MDKSNKFKSSKFYMDEGDILHLLYKDHIGATVYIELIGEDGSVEDSNEIPMLETTTLATTTLATTTVAATTTLAGTDMTIDTDYVGMFSMTIGGTGYISINWGDGLITNHTLTGSNVTLSRLYSSGSHTITISHCENLTHISAAGMDITSVDLPEEATGIEHIDLSDNDMVIFNTYASWVNLSYLDVSSNNLVGIDLREQWVLIEHIDIADNSIAAVGTYASWTSVEYLDASDNLLTTIETHVEWPLSTDVYFSVNGCALTSESDIDTILSEMDSMGHTGGTIDLSGGTNAAPSSAGLTDKESLELRGVTVLVNVATYVYYDDGVTYWRKGVRGGFYVLDVSFTDVTGFELAEDVGWENVVTYGA